MSSCVCDPRKLLLLKISGNIPFNLSMKDSPGNNVCPAVKQRLKKSIGIEDSKNLKVNGGNFFFLRSLINIDC